MRLGIILFCLALLVEVQAQEVNIDARGMKASLVMPIPMKGTNPAHQTLAVNSRYFERNGQPWFPVMGEFHFSRYPEKYWEEQLLKMKQGGIGIVSTYVLWNAHESPEGVWDWTANKDLHAFVALCAKHDLLVWLRIGPYCNAEQLYGGIPEWVQKRKGKRSNDPEYLKSATALYQQIGKVTKGQYFGEGGPVIGVQLENEFASGEADHISTLHQMALDAGIKPVFFSVTANSVFHADRYEVLPLQGAYPYRGWEKDGGGASLDFLYGNDQWIMTDALGKLFYDLDQYPKGMCEQGCGSQVTYANRFVVEPEVVAAHAQNQVGRGMNMMGYYMFQGGTQIPGLKDPTCPESYDFQAPLGEYGLPRASYHQLHVLHQFLQSFGTGLAPMEVLPAAYPVRNPRNTDSIRYSTRTDGNTGFVFLCNTQVRVAMPDKNIRLQVQLEKETIQFPAFTLAGQTAPILPFNLDLFGVTLKYATAQPFAKTAGAVFFSRVKGMAPELCLDATNIAAIDAKGWQKTKQGNNWVLRPNTGNAFQITASNGEKTTVVLLTPPEAENAYCMSIHGKESLVITSATVMATGDQLELRQLRLPDISLKIYPAAGPIRVGETVVPGKAAGIFQQYEIHLPTIKIALPMQVVNASETAVALPASLPAGVSDVFLDVDYLGGSITGKIAGRVVADDLYNGLHWLPGLKRFTGKGSMVLQVQPWDKKITGVQLPAQQKEGIHQIGIVPEYAVKLTF
ncbi:beta-galactosidase [Chitinophaga sp.]|uniref:beta-galactosidase n=1 Tax=Chitinophaga sp. TaxID=1869181 RepID=UPI002F9202AA